MLKNKRAQLAEITLPLVAIGLCLPALYVFVMFSDEFKNKSSATTNMFEEINFNQQYVFTQTKIIFSETVKSCKDCTADELAKKFKETAKWYEDQFYYSQIGNFYGQIRNDKFTIETTESNEKNQNPSSQEQNQNKIYILKIPSLFLQSSIPNTPTKVKRKFDMCLQFDEKGKFLNNC